jgi:hypothetical protein
MLYNSPLLYSVHLWLYGQAHFQLNHQVCSRHNSSRPDYQRRREPTERRWGPWWCQENNLTLNVNKTKALIVDFRRQQREHAHIHINGPQWRRWKASSSSAYLSLSIWNGPPTQTMWWRRRNRASSTSGGWRNVIWPLRHSQTFTDAPASWWSCQLRVLFNEAASWEYYLMKLPVEDLWGVCFSNKKLMYLSSCSIVHWGLLLLLFWLEPVCAVLWRE